MHVLKFLGATVALMLITTGAALAQAVAPDTTVNVGTLVDPWLQLLLATASVVIPALGAWAAAELRRRTGIAIEVAHMQTFQQALTNGAGLLIVKAQQMANTQTIDVRHPAIRDASNYVATSAPDAVKYFGVTPDAIAEKIIAKLGLINSPTTNTVNVTTAPGAVGGPPA